MKCPKRKRLSSNDSGGWDEVFLPCIQRECPWWHETTQSCEVSRIASNLSTIANSLEAIQQSMSTITWHMGER